MPPDNFSGGRVAPDPPFRGNPPFLAFSFTCNFYTSLQADEACTQRESGELLKKEKKGAPGWRRWLGGAARTRDVVRRDENVALRVAVVDQIEEPVRTRSREQDSSPQKDCERQVLWCGLAAGEDDSEGHEGRDETVEYHRHHGRPFAQL